ncbi:MAG: hypothetical protein ACLP1X_03010 [Polyangiaceae bacterium]|jgi:hypothetical protein
MASVSTTAGSRMHAIRGAAVLYGALIGWSCGGGSTGSSSAGGFGSSAGGGFGGSSSGAISGSSTGSPGTGIPMVATLCGDPVCPPLPGEDAWPEDSEAGRPVMDGGSEASEDGSMADGAGSQRDASTEGSDSGGDGGSPDSEAAGD